MEQRFDQIRVVSQFLIAVKLVQDVVMINSTDIRCNLKNIDIIRVMIVKNMLVISDVHVESNVALLFVTNDYKHSKELLLYNNTNSLFLMKSNRLIVHTSGMICTLSSKPLYGMTYTYDTHDEAINRRNAINICNNRNIIYEYMFYLNSAGEHVLEQTDKPSTNHDTISTSFNTVSTDSHIKPYSIFYHRLVEPLETLGVEYLFSIFRICNEMNCNPEQLLYVFRFETSINIISLQIT